MTQNDVLERDSVLDARAFYLQRAFRALLEAMSRPGELVELPEADDAACADARAAGLFPSTVVVADVLLDAATSVSVAGEGGAAAERVLTRRTHVLAADAQAAPYAVLPASVSGAEAVSFVVGLTPGNLLDPQLGATCIVECGTLLGCDAAGSRTGSASGAQAARAWELAGPGVKGTSSFETDRADVLRARIERADEFPCGIDLVLVDRAGHLVAVPRSSTVRAVEGNDDRKGGMSWDM